jgi:hypothetical protein
MTVRQADTPTFGLSHLRSDYGIILEFLKLVSERLQEKQLLPHEFGLFYYL